MSKHKKIYWAAPIHRDSDALANAENILILRKLGFDVWAPQEAGIASDIAARRSISLTEARRSILHYDLAAMKNSDICVAFIDRPEGWSDGQLFEMGWFVGMNKPLIVWNVNSIPLTLMAEFTADFIIKGADINPLVEVLGSI